MKYLKKLSKWGHQFGSYDATDRHRGHTYKSPIALSLFLISKKPWWSSGFASQAEGHSFKPRLVSLSTKINVQNFPPTN